ncbi:MAG: LAGLIDADG family homing endonuclease [bacterium]|nr:LAGLIDADG family homing endonuclease [bacterium]
MEKLSGEYIAGFVDGEGCFALHFRRDIRRERTNKPTYFSWKIQFSIVLRADDVDILKRIKEALECGSISIAKRGYARYQVTDVSDLNAKIVPFFEKNRLQAKKQLDFILWKEAAMIIFKTKRKETNARPGIFGFIKTAWKPEDLVRLEEIQKNLTTLRKITKPHKWIGVVRAV